VLVVLPTTEARSERWRDRDKTGVMRNSVTTCKSGRAHEVSILIVGGTGVGWWAGWEPRAKVSMMSIRPPQHGQGQGCARGSPGCATLGSWDSLTGGGMASNSRARAMSAARVPLANSP
jgi:hypothetical protein